MFLSSDRKKTDRFIGHRTPLCVQSLLNNPISCFIVHWLNESSIKQEQKKDFWKQVQNFGVTTPSWRVVENGWVSEIFILSRWDILSSVCWFVFVWWFCSELEESLIVLPFSVATDMLTLLNHWLQVNRVTVFAMVVIYCLAAPVSATGVAKVQCNSRSLDLDQCV